MSDALPPQVGDIWRDLDRRGGPTFRVLEVPGSMFGTQRVTVVGLDGKRQRTILASRFRAHDGYRTGYTLVERPAGGES